MEKLITEVPPTVTTEGTIEIVSKQKNKKLNEQSPENEKPKDVLLTEDPVGGVVVVE